MRPIIAILRGVTPTEVEAITAELIAAGITRIEVPLNSPDPFDSIQRIAATFGQFAQIGAGTVLSIADVEATQRAGGTLIVSPNADPEIITHTKSLGMQSFPGVFTATEAFSALKAGADGLKLFPGSMAGPEGLKALKAVLPPSVPVYAVGGAGADNLDTWLAAGADGFGIGSALYKPGDSAEHVAKKGRALAAAYDAANV